MEINKKIVSAMDMQFWYSVKKFTWKHPEVHKWF
jgi:hypothetical protein